MDLLLSGPCFCVLLLMLCVGLLIVPFLCDTALCILYGFDNHLAEEERVSCLSMVFLILYACFVFIFSSSSFSKYSKNLCEMANLKRPKSGFQDQLSLNADQKYYRMLQVGVFCNTFDLH